LWDEHSCQSNDWCAGASGAPQALLGVCRLSSTPNPVGSGSTSGNPADTGSQGSPAITALPGYGTLDLRPDKSTAPPELKPKPSDPERRRDWVRLVVTVSLLAMLAFLIVWACFETKSWPDHWNQTKEMLQIILPALIGLIGSVIGFYFGSSTKSNGSGSK